MRRKFEQTLRGVYGDIAKKKIEHNNSDDLSSNEERELATVLNWNFRREAEKRAVGYKTGADLEKRRSNLLGAQKRIFAIQTEKQQLIKELEEERKNLNNPDYSRAKKPEEKTVFFGDGKYYIWHGGEDVTEITLGELITDRIWGIKYYLDPQTVSKEVRKKFALESTKDALYDLLDEQIYIDETTSEKTHEFKKGAYENLHQDKENKVERSGQIAEKAVYGFLRRLSMDFEVDFQVLRADVFEDVEHKIDFILRRKKHKRGVNVETSDDSESGESRGIQFTINMDHETLARKQRQVEWVKSYLNDLEEINDLVLVAIPMQGIMKSYTEWKEQGKPSGGPEKLWDQSTKKEILSGVVQDFLSADEINQLVEKL